MLFIILGIILFIAAFVWIVVTSEEHKFAKGFLALPLLLICVIGCIKSVPTGHTGVVTTFGRVEDYTLEAGVHFINPFSKVIKIDNRTQKQSVEMNAFSSDIQEVKVVYTVNYSIDKANAQNLYKNIGLNYYDVVIAPKVIECVKSVMAQYTAENLVSSRSEVAIKIEDQLAKSLTIYDIRVITTSIEDLDFTDAFTDAVEAKQVAEQNKLKAQTEAETKIIQAEAEAKVKITQAEAEAKSNELLNKTLTNAMLQKLFYEKWDGKLPIVTSGNNGINLLNLADILH